MAAPLRKSTGSLSISVLLGLLIAAALLPPLLLSVFLLDRNNRAQADVVATLAEAAAGAAVQTVDSQLQGMITALRSLSTSSSLNEGDLRRFYVGAQQALAGTASYVIVADGDLNQLLNTRRAFGAPLGKISDPEPAEHALKTGLPTISDGFLGRVANRWVFNIILPRVQPEGDSLLLLLTQDAEALSSALTVENLRGGWNAVIVDNNGTVLASSLMSADVGKPFFLGEEASAVGPVRRSIDLDGKDYELVAKASELSGWKVILWAERDAIERPLERTLRLLMLGGLAMIAVGGLAAWLFGRQISKSVRRLARDAHRLGAGEEVAAMSYPVRELTTVSAAMADAAAQRRAAENEIRFLMREVAHRSKNQLTVVSSIANQSARNAESVAEFSERFQQRLMGLARSTDLLIAGSVAGVELRELITVQIEPFRPAEDTRLQISGPHFRLSLQAAQTLGLAIHEMATNAAKYGAFSQQSGRLSVTWSLHGDELELVWREHVPDLKQRSSRKGFGTQIIERMLPGGLGAKVERHLHPDGLEARFTFPVANIRPTDKHQEER
ncbi:sensor histidine kinase [Arvimicrobium flavum]|uniref:sensor histidine kinase n=1 Tax=Arvimicrobium flavum TaxID=3393320 RepID=UPI00237B0C7E|nr:sensor histidine kinase [Mesorhizobium shangrilense]